jgi:hypothetical protein
MKAYYVLCSLLVLLLNGCFSKEHLEFNNVPVNGNLDEFANELLKLGFTEPKVLEENQIKLKGVFLEKESEIYVYGTKKTQTVYKVEVNLPVEVHDSLEYSFGRMQKLYSLKYGKGTNRYQQYQNAERFLFNEPKRVRHINIGDFTRYRTDSGNIVLEVHDGYISITYSDKLNDEIRKNETKEGTIKGINKEI